jgi:cardiolipin synthase A/B
MASRKSAGGVGVLAGIALIIAILSGKADGLLHQVSTASHGGKTSGTSQTVSPVSDTTSTGSGKTGSTTAGAYYSLVQYPSAGFSGFYAQTNAAKKSIDMEMYELKDTTEESDLVAAVKRHVTVRVLLDSAFSGKEVNTTAYNYLTTNGVSVKWDPSGYIFHAKVTTFDGTTSDVSTANLTSEYYATTADAEIIDTNPTQVAAIEATFNKDWTGTIPRSDTVQAPGLVWSPITSSGTAETALVNQIAAAKRTVDFTSEELADPAIYNALAADAKRGVKCEIVMTNSSSWDTGFKAVTSAGCSVHVYPDSTKALYIHIKQIIDDAGTSTQSVLIGSQNASYTSLTKNREAGLLLTNTEASSVINALTATFKTDYAGASAWSS